MSDPPDRGFELESDPFPAEAADGFFFPTPALSQRIDLVHHLVQFSDLTLVVTGPRGAGKTTFLDELLRSAGERWRCCRIHGSGALDPGALLAALLDGFDLPARGEHRGDALTLLESHLEALHRSQQIALVAIDDAHLLAPETRRAVMDLVGRWEGFRARMLLLEEPGDAAMVDGRGRDLEALVHRVELPALTEEQTGDYVHVRLTRAGLVGDSPFDRGVVRAVHRASEGVPGRVHALAAKVLENQRAAPRARRRPSLAVAALVAIAVVAAALALHRLRAPGPETTTEPVPADAVAGPPPAAPPAPDADGPADDRAAPGLPESVIEPPAAPSEPEPPALATRARPDAPTAPTASAATGPEPPSPAAAEGGPATPSERESAAASETGAAAPTKAETEAAAPARAEPEAAAPADAEAEPAAPADAEAEPAAPAQTEPATRETPEAVEVAEPEGGSAEPADAGPEASTAAPEPESTDSATAESAQTAAAEPESAPAAASGAEPAQADGTAPEPGAPAPSGPAAATPAAKDPAPRPRDPDIPDLRDLAWLRARAPGAFTIQLVGSRDPRSIEQFVERHELGEETAWARTLYEGRDWFVVLHGVYPDIDAARAAIRDLPYGLRRGAPWPRSVAGVLDSAAP